MSDEREGPVSRDWGSRHCRELLSLLPPRLGGRERDSNWWVELVEFYGTSRLAAFLRDIRLVAFFKRDIRLAAFFRDIGLAAEEEDDKTLNHSPLHL